MWDRTIPKRYLGKKGGAAAKGSLWRRPGPLRQDKNTGAQALEYASLTMQSISISSRQACSMFPMATF